MTALNAGMRQLEDVALHINTFRITGCAGRVIYSNALLGTVKAELVERLVVFQFFALRLDTPISRKSQGLAWFCRNFIDHITRSG